MFEEQTTINNIAIEWITGYAFYNVWKEFSCLFTVDTLMNRDIIQGILSDKWESRLT